MLNGNIKPVFMLEMVVDFSVLENLNVLDTFHVIPPIDFRHLINLIFLLLIWGLSTGTIKNFIKEEPTLDLSH